MAGCSEISIALQISIWVNSWIFINIRNSFGVSSRETDLIFTMDLIESIQFDDHIWMKTLWPPWTSVWFNERFSFCWALMRNYFTFKDQTPRWFWWETNRGVLFFHKHTQTLNKSLSSSWLVGWLLPFFYIEIYSSAHSENCCTCALCGKQVCWKRSHQVKCSANAVLFLLLLFHFVCSFFSWIAICTAPHTTRGFNHSKTCKWSYYRKYVYTCNLTCTRQNRIIIASSI